MILSGSLSPPFCIICTIFSKVRFCHPLSSILIISWLNQKHIPSSKCILVKGCSCSAPRDGSPSSLSLLTISFSPLPIFAVSKSLLQLPTSLFWAILPFFHHHFCLDTLHTLSRNTRAIKALARHGLICIEIVIASSSSFSPLPEHSELPRPPQPWLSSTAPALGRPSPDER